MIAGIDQWMKDRTINERSAVCLPSKLYVNNTWGSSSVSIRELGFTFNSLVGPSIDREIKCDVYAMGLFWWMCVCMSEEGSRGIPRLMNPPSEKRGGQLAERMRNIWSTEFVVVILSYYSLNPHHQSLRRTPNGNKIWARLKNVLAHRFTYFSHKAH